MNQRKQNIIQNGIYIFIWLIVFFSPIFIYRNEGVVNWYEVRIFWFKMIPYVILFAVNNYLLIPLLLLKKKYAVYFTTVLAAILILFAVIPLSLGKRLWHHAPHPKHNMAMQKHEIKAGSKPTLEMPLPSAEQEETADCLDGEKGMPESATGKVSAGSDLAVAANNQPDGVDPDKKESLQSQHKGGHPQFGLPKKPMPSKWGFILRDWLLAILLVGFNIAIRLLFKSIYDTRYFKELESQNLKAELNYLKAQINPHFFMNTLNNIHALIDIDSDKAKETVIELSKIMRYVLYDADQPMVPLEKEIKFIDNYIALMSIRYTEEVEVSVRDPDPVSGVKIPPLLLITLIENAFKHGISYRRSSYIHAEMDIRDGWLVYTVRNSYTKQPNLQRGVGLENLRKRLNLLYGENCSLEITTSPDEYSATLEIPIEK